VQFEAKPMLQALPASSLRLQIVRSLAQITQSMPNEIESLFELSNPVAPARRPPPPRSKRMAPVGLERQIVRLLVAHPVLAAELDDEALNAIAGFAPDQAEMLRQLVELSRGMGEQASFATLVEHLREGGSDFDTLIAEIAAETESDLDVVRQEIGRCGQADPDSHGRRRNAASGQRRSARRRLAQSLSRADSAKGAAQAPIRCRCRLAGVMQVACKA